MSNFWTEDRIEFLKANYRTMTNRQLADSLGLKITRCRMKLYELGLKRIEMEYFTEEQIQFLKDNYRTIGDVEMAIIFENKWPKHKPWIKQHICKKRKYLKLKRTPEEIKLIIHKNSIEGGRSYTIDKNSAAFTLPDNYIANILAWRDEEAKAIIKRNPQLIEIKRQSILLTREINKHEQTS